MDFRALYFQLQQSKREEFLHIWADDFSKHVPFVLSHFHEIEAILNQALADLNPFQFADRASFLLRNLNLSLCCDHFAVVIVPLHRQMILADLSLVRRSHQRVLSVWDTTCRLQRAVPLNEDATKGPATIDNRNGLGE